MGMKLKGKPVADSLRRQAEKKRKILGEKGIIPTILMIRVGEREEDIAYEKGILNGCHKMGIKSEVKTLSRNVSFEELKKMIEEANENEQIHGIILFRPLPPHIHQEEIIKVINPKKDVDCMSPANLAKVFEGNSDGFVPCTPRAVIEMLKHYEIPLSGANVVVVGSSMVVGKPLSMLLLDEYATVTICHIRTRNLPKITRSADIVVVAIGKAKFMKKEYFKKDSIVIDVGINEDEKGRICGDVDEDVLDKVKALTPAVGGVGTITTTILLSHVVQACEKMTKEQLGD